MESKAKLLGHPVHPILIVFPLGLLATSVVFDVIALFHGPRELFVAAYWMIAAGIIGGLNLNAPNSLSGLPTRSTEIPKHRAG